MYKENKQKEFSGYKQEYKDKKLLYDGYLKHGKYHRFGMQILHNNIYVGNWKMGKRHGFGSLYTVKNKIEGGWNNDLLHGPCKTYEFERLIEITNYKDGKLHGKSIDLLTNNTTYWINNIPMGKWAYHRHVLFKNRDLIKFIRIFIAHYLGL